MLFKKNDNKEFKGWHLIILLIVAAVAIVFKISSGIWPKATVQIGGQNIKVLVANNYTRWVEGWSNKKNMGDYLGMLFVFNDNRQHIMVMRGMRFSLDIVWLNNKVIVDIAPNAKPELGVVEDKLTQYFARGPSNMVLELPTGFTSQYNIKIGDKIEVLP